MFPQTCRGHPGGQPAIADCCGRGGSAGREWPPTKMGTGDWTGLGRMLRGENECVLPLIGRLVLLPERPQDLDAVLQQLPSTGIVGTKGVELLS